MRVEVALILRVTYLRSYRRQCPVWSTQNMLTSSMLYMHRPPSTSRFTPVINLASSLAMNTHALTTSSTSPILPMGTFPMNLVRFSGVSGMPVNAEKSPVAVTSGQMELTRIW